MGICNSCNSINIYPIANSGQPNINIRQNKINDGNSKKDKNISFSCTYEVNVINNDIQIINNRFGKYINEEIESKIKILNNGQKEKLVYKKKFDGKGKILQILLQQEN